MLTVRTPLHPTITLPLVPQTSETHFVNHKHTRLASSILQRAHLPSSLPLHSSQSLFESIFPFSGAAGQSCSAKLPIDRLHALRVFAPHCQQKTPTIPSPNPPSPTTLSQPSTHTSPSHITLTPRPQPSLSIFTFTLNRRSSPSPITVDSPTPSPPSTLYQLSTH
jgi:hypothetical protein